jgi:Carboxypeptidase regulatory-like domain
MKHLLLLVVAAGSLLAQSQLAQAQTGAQTQTKTGQIKGTVTDEDGSPVSDATVYALPQGLMLDDITPRSVKTDRNGRFDFRGGFPFEAYKLYARKDEDGHPDPLDRFYADSKSDAPRVDLTTDHTSATVTVKLGEQAGILEGRVIDAETGAVLKARLGFLDGQGNGRGVDSDAEGKFRALLPPGKQLTLVVTDPHSGRIQLPVAPLQLEPGQYISMDIPVSMH